MKVGKFITHFGVVLIFSLTTNAQNVFTKTNTVYGELLGHSLVYGSINYDRIFWQSENAFMSMNVGGMYLKKSQAVNSSLNLFFGRNNGHAEISLGYGFKAERYVNEGWNNGSYYSVLSDRKLPMILGRVGYRYQDPNGGIFLRAYISPMILTYDSDPCQGIGCGLENLDLAFHLIGFSLGYSF